MISSEDLCGFLCDKVANPAVRAHRAYCRINNFRRINTAGFSESLSLRQVHQSDQGKEFTWGTAWEKLDF